MGLDMYLLKETYVWPAHMAERGYTPNTRDLELANCQGVKKERVEKIVERVGYWRKANAIHRWFVENVQDGVDNCEKYYVEREQIEALLEVVLQVLDEPSRASELLPTQEGFFFGSVDYGVSYFDDLRHTQKICEDVLLEDLTGGDLYYRSSW